MRSSPATVWRSVAIIARNDSYGTGLVEDATAALTEAGVEVVETVIYAEDAQTFDAEVEQLAAANPEGILLIAFNEASKILTTMVEQGIGPARPADLRCRRLHGQRPR